MRWSEVDGKRAMRREMEQIGAGGYAGQNETEVGGQLHEREFKAVADNAEKAAKGIKRVGYVAKYMVDHAKKQRQKRQALGEKRRVPALTIVFDRCSWDRCKTIRQRFFDVAPSNKCRLCGSSCAWNVTLTEGEKKTWLTN